MNSIFFRSMSKRQRIWLIAGGGLILVFLLAGLMQGNRRPHLKPTAFSVDMNIKQIAPQLGVNVKALARELKLPLRCQFICPFGFISWLVERFSLYCVRIDTNACIECGACAKACPLTAIEGRLEKKELPADCFSCGRCLNICPVDAIRYESLWGT